MSFQFDIKATTRGARPRISFEPIARSILGNIYSLSLVLTADKLATTINKKYRPPTPRLRRTKKKNYSPNVLSFPLGKKEGEIFLNVRKAAREARALRTQTDARIAFLFIHACLHLAGYKHGKKMDQMESETMRKFDYKT